MKNCKFKVKADFTMQGYHTKGKIYEVYGVSFPKLNPEGMFLIASDSYGFQKITSHHFSPID